MEKEKKKVEWKRWRMRCWRRRRSGEEEVEEGMLEEEVL